MTLPSLNVASHLARMAAEEPNRPAVHFPIGSVKRDGPSPHRTLTFAELNAKADAYAHGLESLGITRGVRTALMVPPGEEFFALTFALFKVAAVPVLIDPGMGIKNLKKCLAEAEPAAFIGIPKAHLARRLFGWGKRTIKTTVNVGSWRFFCTASTKEFQQPPHLPRSVATSPSEGEVKREAGFITSPLEGEVKREAGFITSPLEGEVDPRSGSGGGEVAYQSPTVTADDPAAILFTSGSTGIAKGAEYTHGIFAAQVEMLKQTYSIAPGEIDFCTFPLFALFGPALGMTCVVPDMDASRPATIDPRKALSQIRQFGVTNLFGSPAVIRNLSTLPPAYDIPPHPPRSAATSPSGGEVRNPAPLFTSPREGEVDSRSESGGGAFNTIRRVISAGAPANAAVLERFTKLLPPGVQVFTPYGATEALPVANIGSDEILNETRAMTEQGKGVCVGRPVAGIEVFVIGISDEPIAEWNESLKLPPGEIGEFVVRGRVVTKRYFHRDDATRLAKIVDPCTGDVLHRMGDVGYFDEQGRMWFCGRKSHRVETKDGTLFTDMVEPVFNQMPNVARTALVGVSQNDRIIPVLCFELKDQGIYWRLDFEEDLHEFLGRTNPSFVPEWSLIYPGRFPVDVRHNSKIFREKLAVWATKQLKT